MSCLLIKDVAGGMFGEKQRNGSLATTSQPGRQATNDFVRRSDAVHFRSVQGNDGEQPIGQGQQQFILLADERLLCPAFNLLWLGQPN